MSLSLIGPPLQQSLEDAVVVEGIGLHSGAPARMFLRPAPPNTGIRFRRIDLKGRPEVAATLDRVTRTHLQTTLGNGTVEVYTVEHVLSALVAMGIDNAIVEVDGPEVPIFDGSAGPFVRLIRDVGTVLQPAEKQVWLPVAPVEVNDGDAWVRVEPADELVIDFTIVYDNPVIGRQRLVYHHDPVRYETEIAHARTFGLVKDVDRMRAAGYALGGDFHNAVVVGEDAVLNEDGLRYPDEFVRHKILDLIGDLGLVGGAMVGAVTAHKSGHTLNRRVAAELAAQGLVRRTPVSKLAQVLAEQDGGRLRVLSG